MILKEREQELISKYFEFNFKINVPLNTESHISQSLVINEYQEIIKEILCPICTEIPLNPVKCSNCGNILCEECEKKINKCPFNCPNFKFLHLDRIFKNVFIFFNFPSKIYRKCQLRISRTKDIIPQRKFKFNSWLKNIKKI